MRTICGSVVCYSDVGSFPSIGEQYFILFDSTDRPICMLFYFFLKMMMHLDLFVRSSLFVKDNRVPRLIYVLIYIQIVLINCCRRHLFLIKVNKRAFAGIFCLN